MNTQKSAYCDNISFIDFSFIRDEDTVFWLTSSIDPIILSPTKQHLLVKLQDG